MKVYRSFPITSIEHNTCDNARTPISLQINDTVYLYLETPLFEKLIDYKGCSFSVHTIKFDGTISTKNVVLEKVILNYVNEFG
jgi:hypothetical protein